MKNLKIYFILIALFLFSNCQKDAASPIAPKDLDEQVLLDLVNAYRISGCNCDSVYYPPVNTVMWNDTLEQAAQNHSIYMDVNNNFSHTGSNGSSAGDRINYTGYSWSTYGENIAAGYSTENDVIVGWMASPGHCRNIMNANFKEMGVGASGAYWTQVFASH